jgi:hypothetical protein
MIRGWRNSSRVRRWLTGCEFKVIPIAQLVFNTLSKRDSESVLHREVPGVLGQHGRVHAGLGQALEGAAATLPLASVVVSLISREPLMK